MYSVRVGASAEPLGPLSLPTCPTQNKIKTLQTHGMGNDVKKPSAPLLRQPDLFHEVQDAKISHIREAADFWMTHCPDTARIGSEEFDEMFSCVFKDTEIIYPMFGKRTAVVVDVFCILALLAQDSVEAKLKFLYYLFADDFAVDCKRALCRAFLGVMNGVACLFNCIVPIKDTVLDYVIAAVQKLVDLNGAERVKIDQKDFPMQLHEFIQLVQEDRYVSAYVDEVLGMCRVKQYITDAVLTVNRHAQESKLMSGMEEDVEMRKKGRHPLWRYTIMDLFEESWLLPLPQMDVHDSVLCVMEHCILSKKNAVPVYCRTPVDTRRAQAIAAKTKSSQMSEAIAAIMRNAGGKGSAQVAAADAHVSVDDHVDENTFLLFDIVDMHSFVYWLAASAPATVINSRHLERANEGLSVYATRKPKRRVKGASAGPKLGTGGPPSSAGKMRRMSTLPIQDQWQEAGDIFATTQIKVACVEEQTVMSGDGKTESPGAKLSKQQGSSSVPAISSLNSFAEAPRTVRYTQANVFQTDQYMYNVIDQIANGFRLIPIASSRLKPYTVTQIVTSKQVVSFLRLFAAELLGKLVTKPVGRSGLMRRAPSIPKETNFGTAIVALAECRVECIPITDDQLRFCGRIDAQCVQHFWWTWKLNLIRRTGTTVTLDTLQHEYSRNNVLIPSGSGLNYSHFSSLLSPLSQCSELGIRLSDFDEVRYSGNIFHIFILYVLRLYKLQVMKVALKANIGKQTLPKTNIVSKESESDSDEVIEQMLNFMENVPILHYHRMKKKICSTKTRHAKVNETAATLILTPHPCVPAPPTGHRIWETAEAVLANCLRGRAARQRLERLS